MNDTSEKLPVSKRALGQRINRRRAHDREKLNGVRTALPGLAQSVIDGCRGHRRWHSLEDIAGIAGVSRDDAQRIMHNIKTNRKHYVRVEVKKVGREIHYRIFKQDKTVSLDELTEKLTPIIKGLMPKAGRLR